MGSSATLHYLLAFSESRRYDRPCRPYDAPGNPAAEHGEAPIDIDAYNALAPGQPSLWCKWQPAWGGAYLTFNAYPLVPPILLGRLCRPDR